MSSYYLLYNVGNKINRLFFRDFCLKRLLNPHKHRRTKGASKDARPGGKPGKSELALHRAVFLDEIGDMPLEMQHKLLWVLEKKGFERVGGTSLIRSDFRLIAATTQKLEEMLAERRFRKDLFYRLSVIPPLLPPLRNSQDDIIPIARYFLKKMTQDTGLPEPKLRNFDRVMERFAWRRTRGYS